MDPYESAAEDSDYERPPWPPEPSHLGHSFNDNARWDGNRYTPTQLANRYGSSFMERQRRWDELRHDLQDRMHVDTIQDQVYQHNGSNKTTVRSFRTIDNGSEQAMRDHLKAVLPEVLIQDEYGHVVPIEEVSSQHLTKLQAKSWHEVPKATVNLTAWTASRNDYTTIIAKSVHSIAKALASKNYVFILRDRSSDCCHYHLCRNVQRDLETVASPYEMTCEPLIDWSTLEPATINPIYDPKMLSSKVQFFRRNQTLLDRFSINTWKFVPFAPIKLCQDCLQSLVDNRDDAWHIIEQIPNVLQLDSPAPWLKYAEKVDKDEAIDEQEPSDTAESSASGEVITPSSQIAEHSQRHSDLMLLSTLDGIFDDWREPRPKAFEIWRDSTPGGEAAATHNVALRHGSRSTTPSFTQPRSTCVFTNSTDERRPIQAAGWNPINSFKSSREIFYNPVIVSPHNAELLLVKESQSASKQRYNMYSSAYSALQDTFSMPEKDKYPTAHAGFPTGPPQEYQHKPGVSFSAMPMRDYGLLSADQSGSESRPKSDSQSWDETSDAEYEAEPRRFGDERDGNATNTSPRLSWSSYEQRWAEWNHNYAWTESSLNAQAPVPGAPERPQNREFPWPMSSNTPCPVPAQPWPYATSLAEPNPEIFLSKPLPCFKQLICSCKEPAETRKSKIVQCWNPDCHVGWYHYACIDMKAKISSLWGRWICDACKQMGPLQLHRKTDFTMPFTKEEILGKINGCNNVRGFEYPYGLGEKMDFSSDTNAVSGLDGVEYMYEFRIGESKSPGELGFDDSETPYEYDDPDEYEEDWDW
ncbi:Inhibitor of growth protein 5 [Kalmusia sp. IMI 367209]|nr:Inhibitor of growth protein 5 [Kalmusia sp. IMI 367209]